MKTRQEETIKELHRKHFGSPPSVISWAPGRAEVLGNHTDYNQGTVLSIAIDKGHCFAISPNGGRGFRLLAVDIEKTVSFDISEISPVAGAAWAGYVKGVFYYLKEKGLPIADWDCSFLGNIPVGSGLSSSAALEVSAAWAAMAMTGIWIDPVEVAKLCREAEFRFAGCNCGLLDQFSSIFGKDHCLIHSDFRTLDITPVSLPGDILFLMVTPAVTHSLAESPYNRRRESCEQAVRELGGLMTPPPESLRDVTPEAFEALKGKIDPEAARRAAHIVGEIDRVETGAAALARGDITLFGDLMYRSHESSRINFENSCPELDLIVEAAREAGALGARLSGGGWGGSLIVLTREDSATELKNRISRLCSNRGLSTHISRIRPSGGAEILS
jgi:galactokinase